VKISVKAKDRYLYQKIKLILGESVMPQGYSAGADLTIADEECYPDTTGALLMAREGICDLKIPFTEEELKEVVFGAKKENPMLTLGDKCAILKGERIPLTELEYSLLSILVGAKGEYVGREKLLLSVWGKDVAEGILNVYVHYLREKLEKSGEKIIVSSRKQGYKISERYKG
jgi:hypothetical protein